MHVFVGLHPMWTVCETPCYYKAGGKGVQPFTLTTTGHHQVYARRYVACGLCGQDGYAASAGTERLGQ
jgi:hypothetical protein